MRIYRGNLLRGLRVLIAHICHYHSSIFNATNVLHMDSSWDNECKWMRKNLNGLQCDCIFHNYCTTFGEVGAQTRWTDTGKIRRCFSHLVSY
jgi:hypothetical protein